MVVLELFRAIEIGVKAYLETSIVRFGRVVYFIGL
jgi:hypothetical protein